MYCAVRAHRIRVDKDNAWIVTENKKLKHLSGRKPFADSVTLGPVSENRLDKDSQFALLIWRRQKGSKTLLIWLCLPHEMDQSKSCHRHRGKKKGLQLMQRGNHMVTISHLIPLCTDCRSLTPSKTLPLPLHMSMHISTIPTCCTCKKQKNNNNKKTTNKTKQNEWLNSFKEKNKVGKSSRSGPVECFALRGCTSIIFSVSLPFPFWEGCRRRIYKHPLLQDVRSKRRWRGLSFIATKEVLCVLRSLCLVVIFSSTASSELVANCGDSKW